MQRPRERSDVLVGSTVTQPGELSPLDPAVKAEDLHRWGSHSSVTCFMHCPKL